jgi:hypothetical protein
MDSTGFDIAQSPGRPRLRIYPLFARPHLSSRGYEKCRIAEFVNDLRCDRLVDADARRNLGAQFSIGNAHIVLGLQI